MRNRSARARPVQHRAVSRSSPVQAFPGRASKLPWLLVSFVEARAQAFREGTQRIQARFRKLPSRGFMSHGLGSGHDLRLQRICLEPILEPIVRIAILGKVLTAVRTRLKSAIGSSLRPGGFLLSNTSFMLALMLSRGGQGISLFAIYLQRNVDRICSSQINSLALRASRARVLPRSSTVAVIPSAIPLSPVGVDTRTGVSSIVGSGVDDSGNQVFCLSVEIDSGNDPADRDEFRPFVPSTLKSLGRGPKVWPFEVKPLSEFIRISNIGD